MPELGPLGFGAANLGNLYREVTDEEANAALEAAWAGGIRYFDTAPHYGLGLSEKRLGAFLQTKPRDEFILSTKVGRLLRPNPHGAGADTANDFLVPSTLKREWDFSADGIRRSHDESLERMGLDRIDILFLHDPEKCSLDEADELAYPALIGLRDSGLVRGVGIGSMSTEALVRAARTPGLDVLMVAGRLTLLEQPAAAEVIPAALENGMSVVAAGVYNSGLLSSTVVAAGARYEYVDAPAELVERARAIAAVCARFGVELPTAALQYTLRIPPVRSVVFGSGRPGQIADNVSRVGEPIPDELWSSLATEGLIPWL